METKELKKEGENFIQNTLSDVKGIFGAVAKLPFYKKIIAAAVLYFYYEELTVAYKSEGSWLEAIKVQMTWKNGLILGVVYWIFKDDFKTKEDNEEVSK